MERFSDRYGYTKPSNIFVKEGLTKPIQDCICSCIDELENDLRTVSIDDYENLSVLPIEVKSGKRYSTVSLKNFMEKYKDRIGESYIIHPRNLIIKDDIICIPPYMTMML